MMMVVVVVVVLNLLSFTWLKNWSIKVLVYLFFVIVAMQILVQVIMMV